MTEPIPMTGELTRRLAYVKSVSFGYTGIHIYQSEELKDVQVGYSISLNGDSLIDGVPGSWQKNWIVVGCEELCGDPIFADVSSEDCPVYTAMHGEGSWTPNLIADSIEGFAKALESVATIASNRATPVELEKNPLSIPELNEVLDKIQRNNPTADINFWQEFLSTN